MSESMQAVVFQGAGGWAVESRPIPRISNDGEVLLRVDAGSICGTDLHILATPPGHPATPNSVLGHEYAGTVVEIAPGVAHLQPGDRVVIDPNITCGLCAMCRQGLTNACENMTTLGIFRDGGLAGMNLAPARSLHKISRGVPPEHAALAEPLSCVWHAFGKAKPAPGESVAIIGGGPIGILFAMLFKAAGAGLVFLSEKVEFRRKLAAACGADCVIDPAAENPVEVVRANTARGADIVVDAAGASFSDALKMVRGAGRVILFGMIQQSDCTVNQYSMVRNEVTVYGSFIQRTAFPEVVRVIESGKLPLAKLVTHQFGLGEFGTAVDLLRRGQSLKAVLRPSS